MGDGVVVSITTGGFVCVEGNEREVG